MLREWEFCNASQELGYYPHFYVAKPFKRETDEAGETRGRLVDYGSARL
jgi:hypothetical protein